VTIADSRVRPQKQEPDSGMGKKADTRSRSLHVYDLPQSARDVSTTESLLQQAFEKHVPVKRIEFFADKHEAVIEFETAADAAKLLLLQDPIVFEGKTLRLTEEVDSSGARSAAPGLFVPRKAASRPRAGLGHARKTRETTASEHAPGSSTSKANTGKASQDDFRKMLSGGK